MDLTIIIPARNEEFLDRTLKDLVEHIEGKTEIIAILDGYLPDSSLTVNDPRVSIIYNPEALGQRAASNQAARVAKGKYIMKVDAHCAFDQGFDVKMVKAMEGHDNWTLIPLMRNLHAYDWVCPNGHRRYQGPSGKCHECGEPTVKDVVWIPKESPKSIAFRFDTDMHFQYWNEYGYKQLEEAKSVGIPINVTETMSIQGSCFMLTKKKYFELDICSEEFHSWGQQGVEVACKTWLSGGKVMVLHTTWYAHMFRTQGGDFSFPYPNPQSKVVENRQKSRELFYENKWPKSIYNFQWMLDKFNPPDWNENTKGIIYYSDNQLDERVAKPVREQLVKIGKDKNIPIVSACLKKTSFASKNISFPSLKRGYLSMFKQILGALENSTASIIYFCEHDVLYHPTHFDFTPPEKDTFYYNENVWMLRLIDGHCLHYDVKQLSGLCVYREAAITHFKERIKMVEKDGYSSQMGFEPFTHGRIKWQNQFKCASWKSFLPNIDIKHGNNVTGQRWRKDQYRNQSLLINWIESETIEGWGKGTEIIKQYIRKCYY